MGILFASTLFCFRYLSPKFVHSSIACCATTRIVPATVEESVVTRLVGLKIRLRSLQVLTRTIRNK